MAGRAGCPNLGKRARHVPAVEYSGVPDLVLSSALFLERKGRREAESPVRRQTGLFFFVLLGGSRSSVPRHRPYPVWAGCVMYAAVHCTVYRALPRALARFEKGGEDGWHGNRRGGKALANSTRFWGTGLDYLGPMEPWEE